MQLELFRLGERSVTVATVAAALLVIVGTVVLSRFLRRKAQRALDHHGGSGGGFTTAASLVHYVVLLVGFGTAASTLGLDLSALFAAGAIFAIGLGFAMQSIAQNFVAGIILLMERTVRPGDVIELDGEVMMVREMGIRASLVRSRDAEDIIIPNSNLIQNQVKNLTMANRDYRVRAQVGVSYSSDMAVVRQVLEQAGKTVSERWGHGQDAQVLLLDFGDNSVVWEAAGWINDPWQRRMALDSLRELIWWGFKDAGICIAFPQIDVHLDASSLDALRGLAKKVPTVA